MYCRYVRIGSGNQLIRNPKKRTRVLASEKVRWSLHTARQRLVKRRKYCQFFTRFGKCNKDNGKCPYIHDPSKIAVCTKFLKGLCLNPVCKLTHKVCDNLALLLLVALLAYCFINLIMAGFTGANARLFLFLARCHVLDCPFLITNYACPELSWILL